MKLNDSCKLRYAKKWFEVQFYNDPFNFPQAPRDSIIEATWHQIDTNMVELRNLYQGLEDLFGNFILRKEFPDCIDTNVVASKVYLIRFSNYTNIDSVINFLSNELIKKIYYLNNAVHLLSNINEQSFEMGNLKEDGIKSRLDNGCMDYHKNSLEWNLFSIHTPLVVKLPCL